MRRETHELSGSYPEFRLIGGSDLCVSIPAARLDSSAARAVVTVYCAGRPVPQTDLLVLFPNKTWKRASTDANGAAGVDLDATHLPLTVFAAAAGHGALVRRDWVPANGALSLELDPLPDGGAVIITEETGSLPGLAGRLNPIRDTLDRTYLYASNVAINQGQPQPVHFLLGDTLRLTDSDGRERLARIVDIIGRAALLEYRPVT